MSASLKPHGSGFPQENCSNGIKPTLVILAAGIGSRYGGLKQIDPVGPSGELIIEYSVYDAIRAGFGRVIFVINEKIDKLFREKIGDKVSAVIPVEYVYQRLDDVPPGFAHLPKREKPWGTGHAVYCCRDLIDGPFAALNADDFYGASAFQNVGDFISGAGANAGANALFECCMPGYLIDNTLTENGYVSRGVCLESENNYLVGLTERKQIERRGDVIVYVEENENPVIIEPGTLVSMNMWGFPGHIMVEFERQFHRFLGSGDNDLSKAELYLPMVVNEMLENNIASVKVLRTEDKWYGVTYREDKEHVQQAIAAMVKSGKYPERLWPD